jgi:hypothetical protein
MVERTLVLWVAVWSPPRRATPCRVVSPGQTAAVYAVAVILWTYLPTLRAATISAALLAVETLLRPSTGCDRDRQARRALRSHYRYQYLQYTGNR